MENKDGLSPTDPDKVVDALYGTGVDLKEEESLLRDQTSTPFYGLPHFSTRSYSEPLAPLMMKTNVLTFAMQKILEQGLALAPGTQNQMAEFLTVACEEMLAPVLEDVVMFSRHRRRPIRQNNGKSELARALRDLAVRQKELETRRSAKKAQLGIQDDDSGSVPGVEELSHRAANQTAAMMVTGRSKTYSWMQGPSGGGRGAGKSEKDVDRVRYREARQEEIFSVRDLVKALERRRRGVSRTLAKSQEKLKDIYR